MPQYPEWSWLSIFLQKAFSETKGWFWWVLGGKWLEFLVQCMEQKLTWFSLSWGCEHHRKLKPEIKMNPDRKAGTGALLPTLTERNQDFCSWNIPRDWVPVEINCRLCLSGISEEGGAGGSARWNSGTAWWALPSWTGRFSCCITVTNNFCFFP